MFSKLAISLMILLISVSTHSFAATPVTEKDYTLEIGEITSTGQEYSISEKDSTKKFVYKKPQSAELDERLQPGNRLEIKLHTEHQDQITEIVAAFRPCGVVTRLLALGLAFSAIIGFFTLAGGGKPQVFVIGQDQRYSNSKTQVVLWFSALMTVYLATLGLRLVELGWDYFGGIAITENLLALSGISAITYGAAKAITVSKLSKAGAEIKRNRDDPELSTDLFQNDHGDFDLGDTQMFFFTLLAVGVFLLTSFHFLNWLAYAREITLPDVDTTLLSSLGISQVAYMAKKAGSKVGNG